MWKTLRITFLLLALATVALSAWREKQAATDWTDTLHVALFPINADGSPEAARRIAALERDSFEEIDDFLAAEVARYGIKTLKPVHLTLQAPLNSSPPAPPRGGSRLDVVLWSLKLRYWAWRQPQAVPRPNVRLYVNFWGGDEIRVPDSHGLKEGLIGVVNVFADASMQRPNAVVIAHELLHTLDATDKYDPQTLEPLFPQGYADPAAEPRLPQQRCELMAGRIPQLNAEPRQPRTLAQCLIGEATAREIALLR